MFGLLGQEKMTAQKIWQHLFVEVYDGLSEGCRQHIAHILEHGSLAKRIMAHTGKNPSRDKLVSVYTQLAHCLHSDIAFV